MLRFRNWGILISKFAKNIPFSKFSAVYLSALGEFSCIEMALFVVFTQKNKVSLFFSKIKYGIVVFFAVLLFGFFCGIHVSKKGMKNLFRAFFNRRKATICLCASTKRQYLVTYPLHGAGVFGHGEAAYRCGGAIFRHEAIKLRHREA